MKQPDDITCIKIEINYSLADLKKAFSRFHGVKNWRSVKKSDISEWIASLAQADIEMDMDEALSENID